ncbi:MAG: hypothetical protein M8349_03575 [ANME-2 cluster archaeon]|nr:hypothetical protein [ANME-2 cluster archaeon]MDF1557054.1 hypothetical protein [ANME-2 cluster archaeon]
MSEAQMLNEIKTDLNFLKEKMARIEVTVNEIDKDLHSKPNPEYVKKLNQIEKENSKVHFEDMDEFDKQFGL